MELNTAESDANTKYQAKQLGFVYHCVCGFEFRIDPEVGGECPQCKRIVQPEAIRTAMSATVSLAIFPGEQESDVNLHHFEVDDDQHLANRLYGHFRIDRKLGTGGMGAVYRALDTSLQRYVAVKVMRNANHCVDSRIAMLLREAVAQARLNHPNVVTIYYVGRQDEEPFLAMELLPGPTLAEKLKSDGTIPYADAIQYAIQVASALKHASKFGIVHADIKPANLLISGEGTIKLSDFGLSRIQNAPDQSTTVSGTPAYVAPELMQGSPISIQSDMYALGVTLFELVFGRHPIELVGTTLREFAGPIRTLMAKNPSDRYSSYDELMLALKRIEPVKTTPAGFALRSMAYGIDQLMLLLFFVPFAFTIWFLNNAIAFRDYQWISHIVAFVSLMVPAVYLILIYRGWRTLGRYLFQLRIVEENGLLPRREQLVTREVLRNSFAWFVPLVVYVDPSFQPDHLMSRIIQFLFALFLAIDWATTLLLKGQKTLHDYLCHSRVVLAVDRGK
jgi:eukaryotic-like serine/threonine-protein kinase